MTIKSKGLDFNIEPFSFPPATADSLSWRVTIAIV